MRVKKKKSPPPGLAALGHPPRKGAGWVLVRAIVYPRSGPLAIRPGVRLTSVIRGSFRYRNAFGATNRTAEKRHCTQAFAKAARLTLIASRAWFSARV